MTTSDLAMRARMGSRFQATSRAPVRCEVLKTHAETSAEGSSPQDWSRARCNLPSGSIGAVLPRSSRVPATPNTRSRVQRDAEGNLLNVLALEMDPSDFAATRRSTDPLRAPKYVTW